MIALLAASSIYMSALQAGIAGPTDAFRACLRDASTKARSEKIAGTAIEIYLKNACSTQKSSLEQALVAFRMKNGMSHKAASADASMTVDDYVSTPAENYKFIAGLDAKPASPVAATPPTTTKPTVTPASAPAQAPKP